MSIKIMMLVKDHADKTNARKFLTLLAMADFANDEGQCWPSAETVGDWIGVDAKQARRYIREYVDEGILEVVRKGGGTYTNIYGETKGIPNRYQFNIPSLVEGGSKDTPISGGSYTPPQEGDPTPPPPTGVPSHESEEPSLKAEEPSLKKGGEPSVKPTNKNHQSEDSSSPSGEEQRKILRAFTDYFVEVTALDEPDPQTVKGRKSAAVRWWQPIRRMVSDAEWDIDACRLVLQEAIEQMDGDRLTIEAPQSVEKNFRATIAAIKRGAYRRPDEPAGDQAIRDYVRRTHGR